MPEQSLARTADPPQPTADYELMHQAFTQTERGRWFLEQFIRRQRNPEIAALLQAVERIEAAIVARNTAPSSEAYRAVLEVAAQLLAGRGESGARADAASAAEIATATIRKSAEQIRELGWAMRGQNYDETLCDQLDSRIAEIANACAVLHDAASNRQDTELLLRDLQDLIARGLASDAGASADNADAAPPHADPAPAASALPAAIAAPIEAVPVQAVEATAGFEPAPPVPQAAPSPQWVPDDTDPPVQILTIESPPIRVAADASISQTAADGPPVLPPAEPDPEPIKAIAREINHALGEDVALPVPPVQQDARASQTETMPPPEVSPEPAPPEEPKRAPSSPGQAAVVSLRQHMKAAQVPPRDPLAPIKAMSEEEKLALFS